ncbi:TonB-dependent receptor [Pseudomonas sp. FW300-N2F2]|uniref:TonB-dependent receptor n=1 Tax=Pseudomonas sp. FW300-N2F2 TaxID=2751320 RepID=UPI001A91CB15|nr:TonB-dependent receptor [Pseudomonas sp. FW300-N2F2]
MIINAGLGVPNAALAEQAPAQDDTRLPEVKVTAERRETTLQKTPVTVNVIDANELEKRSVTKLADLAGLAAGVNIPNQWTNTQSVFIRGIGSSRPIGNPSVGWYLDDVYIPRSFGSSFLGSLPDIERVEVLHGPQGTLYGQNTSSGALKLISRQPTAQPHAWASVGLGNQGQVETRGYATGTLSPELLTASVALASSHIDGDVDNHYLDKDVNGYENKQFRTIFHLTPSDTFDAVLSVDGLHGHATGGPTPTNYPGSGKRRNFSDIGEEQNYDSGGASLKLQSWLNDQLSVKSVTAYRNFDVDMPSDDPYPTYVQGFDQDLNQEQYSQEFQLLGDYGRLSFITGLMLWHEVFEMDRLSWNNNAFSVIDSKSTTNSIGLYGQSTYKFTDALSLTLGLRLNKEWREMDSAAYNSNATGAQLAQRYSVNGLKEEYEAVTPKVTLDYQWTPELLTYATWAVGETAGGWNPASASLAIAQTPVDPEKVTSYELGLKSTLWDGRLRNNLALFYNDYEDYQASINNPVVNGQLITGAVIANAGQAHTYGAEWESTLKASRNLEFNLNLAYLRTRFDEFLNPTGAASTDFTGYELPYAPRWSGSIGSTYSVSLQNGGDVRLNANYRSESSSYSAVSATNEYTKFPSTHYLDAGIFYTTPDADWTFSVTAKNLLNKTYELPGSYVPALDFYSVNYNRERQLLFTVRHDFL